MKIGVRKPNLKKSLKARTTGRMKRTLKRNVNPFYGKKGMGWVNNPKKALYNKFYRKTTVSLFSPVGFFTACFDLIWNISAFAVVLSVLLLYYSMVGLYYLGVFTLSLIISIIEHIRGKEIEFIESIESKDNQEL